MQNKSDLIIYTTEDGLTKIDVTFDDNTVWLSQADMAELFQKAKSTINEHIKNIYDEGELIQEQTMRKFGNSEFLPNLPIIIILMWLYRLVTE